jgi:uncharacterized protein (DUF2267 family)
MGRTRALDGRRSGPTPTGMALDYATFIAAVQEEANLPYEAAERATRATLQTLGERLSEGQARDIAEQLPTPLRPVIVDGRDPEPFDVGEFVRRVAERENVSKALAREHARAVFAALGKAVSHKEIEDTRAQLPASFADFIAAAEQARALGDTPAELCSADDIDNAVAERAGIDRPRARRATRAVLEALANRIAGGEVDDIAAMLPSELQEPLARGKAKSKGVTKPLSLEEFVREIADLEGVDEDTAVRHARAVFATLRALVGAKEYGDMYAQLPDDYAVLLGPRPNGSAPSTA